MATVQMLLTGTPLAFADGDPAFCGVSLVTSRAPDGAEVRIMVDVGHVGRRRVLLHALEQRGLTAEDIDVVVLTHGHWDHIQNIDLFPSARLCLSESEAAYVESPSRTDYGTPLWTKRVFVTHPVLVRPGDLLADGVHVLDAAGHTVGSIAIGVENAGVLDIIAGDAMQDGTTAKTGRNEIVFWDQDAADATVGRLRSYGGVIYPGHDRPFRYLGGTVEYLEPEGVITVRGLERAPWWLRQDPEDNVDVRSADKAISVGIKSRLNGGEL